MYVLTKPVVYPRVVRRRTVVQPRASVDLAVTGKFLGLFVLFASTTNWWFYRRAREDAEKKK